MSESTPTLKKLLVPVDGSQWSVHATRVAAQLADGLGAKVTLFFAFEFTGISRLGRTYVADEEFARLKARAIDEAFGPSRDILAGRDFEEETAMGDPAIEILGAARRRQIDLIVLGSRGLTQFQSLVLGSVTDKVVHHATCAVMVVR